MRVAATPVQFEGLDARAETDIEMAAIGAAVILKKVLHHALIEHAARREPLELLVIGADYTAC